MSRMEEGIYRGRAVAGSEQYGQTKNGNDQIVINLTLDSGEELSTFLVFTEGAAPYSMQRLRALGWTGNNLADLTGIDANEVGIEVKYEEFQGEQKMKVQIVTGGGVVLKDQLDDKGKKAFAAKYAALAKTTPAPAATAPAPRRAAPTQRQAPPPAPASSGGYQSTGSDDEIPF